MKLVFWLVVLLSAVTVMLFGWQEMVVEYCGRTAVEAIGWSLFAAWIATAALGWRTKNRAFGKLAFAVSLAFLAFMVTTLVSSSNDDGDANSANSDRLIRE